MLEILSLLSLFAAVAGVYYFVVYNPVAHKGWEKIRCKAEYLAAHQGHAACFSCGSNQRLDLGLLRFTDYRRRIICSECKSILWREEEK